MHERREPPQRPKLIRAQDVYRLVGVGWYFGICVGGGTYAGYRIDRVLGGQHWFLLAGLALGSFMGFYGMYLMLKPLINGPKRTEADK